MKANAECIFCKIVVGQVPCFRLFEDDDTFAFMDNYPANDGHCLVLAKEHYPTLFDVSDEDLSPSLVVSAGSRGRSTRHYRRPD